MMKQLFFATLSLFIILLQVRSGHIFTQPSELVPQNARQASTFNLFFLLETALLQTDYIYVKFPINLGAATASLYTNMDYTVTFGRIALTRVGGTDPEHYFSFPVGTNLLPQTWYRMVITAESSKISEQNPGSQGCITISTTSDITEDRIVYDTTSCADYLTLAPLVDETFFKVTGSYSIKNLASIYTFGQSYTAFFDVTPSVEIEGGSIIVLTIDQTSDFTFGSACSSVACSINSAGAGSDCPGIYDIPLVTSTCASIGQILTFNLNQKLALGNTFRIQATITNSKTLVATAKTVRAVHKSRKAETWFGVTTVTSASTNGLQLKTAYPSYTVSGSQKLFWGLSYVASVTGAVGCPLTLYRNKAGVSGRVIFNSVQTSFSVSSSIPSLSGSINFLQINWFPFESDDVMYSMIMGSLSTNLPFISGNSTIQSCTKKTISSPVTDYVNCRRLDSINAATYTISVKYSIKYTLGTTGTGTVGRIEIKTGEAVPTTVASATGTQMTIKTNIEYSDSDTTNLPAAKVFSNRVYSYDYSASLFSSYPLFQVRTAEIPIAELDKLTTAALCYFSGVAASCTTAAYATGGRAGLWIKPTTSDSTIHGVFLPLKSNCPWGTGDLAGNCMFCSDTITGSSCTQATLVGDPTKAISVMLKVIFNNNVLGIPETEFSKGVYLVGFMFGILKTDDNTAILLATATYVADYGVNSAVNFITKASSYAHLTLICITADAVASEAKPFKNCAIISTTSKWGGIAFHNTRIQSYPSLYVDDKVSDFIFCVKGRLRSGYSTLVATDETSTWTLLESGTVSGPGIINSYVITNKPSTSSASFVNYYEYATPERSNGNNYATYLRVYATFTANTLTRSGAYVGVFFDGVKSATPTPEVTTYDVLKKYAFGNKLTIVDHVSAKSVQGTVIGGAHETATPAFTVDHWWTHSGVIAPSPVTTAASTVNLYIPCLSGVSQLTSLNLAIFDFSSTSYISFSVNSVYRIFGGVFDATAKREGLAIAAVTIAANVAAQAKYSIDTWVSTLTGSSTKAYEIGTALRACFAITDPAVKAGFKDAATMKPGKTMATVIYSDVTVPLGTDCDIGTGNDIATDKLGGAYILYSKEGENIFTPSSLPGWDYTEQGLNKCIYHNFEIYDTSDSTKDYPIVSTQFYTILCQTDKSGSVSYGANNKGIILDSFTVPFYWGESYLIGSKIHHVWSNPTGLAVAVAKDTSSVSTWSWNTCTVSTVSGVAKDTKDVSYSLTLTTQVSYRIPRFGASGGVLTIEEVITSGSPTFVGCIFNGPLNCAMASNTMTLSTPNAAPYKTTDYMMAKGTVTLTIILDNTNTIQSTTHGTRIRYNNLIVETCSLPNGVTYDLTATSIVSTISLDKNPKFINMKGARGTFSFSFFFPRQIRPNYFFTFNLGYFVNPTQISNNARCIITTTNGVPSNNFKSLSTKDLTKSVLTVRNELSNGGTFVFKCIGGSTTDYTTNIGTSISATYSRGGASATEIGKTTLDTEIAPTNILDNVAPSSLSMTKLYKTAGFDADYLISFMPFTADVTLKGRVYVEFSSSIPPRLNYGGIAECYINEVPAFCALIDERRLEIWPNIILSKNNTKNYVLRIAGVTQPTDYDLNGYVYFALDLDANTQNGIMEQGFIQEIFDTTSTKPNIIYMHDFAITTNRIRTTNSISVVVLLPANTVLNTGSVYIQFPASFSRSLFHSPSATCSLKRIGDNSGFEFAKNCILLRGRKFIINLNSDTLNSIPLNYTITFSNILSPQNVNLIYFRENFQVFTVSADNTTITASTGVGNRNSTVYMWFSPESNYILLNWLNTEGNFAINRLIDISIGLYTAVPALATMNGDNYNNTFTWQFAGVNTSSFATQQINSQDSSILKIVNGYSKTSFYIGAKENVVPSIYYLATTKTGDISNTYSPVPFMDIRAVLTTCTIAIQGNTYNLPIGGFSAPIILDFSSCIPMSDVIITANLTNGALLALKFDNGLTVQSQTLKFDQITSNYKIYFYVYSDITLSNITSGSSSLTFALSGTDGPYYSVLSSVSINLIPAVADIPIVANPQVYPGVGSTQITFSCSQPGYIYYSLGLGASSASVSIAQIAAVTQNIKVSMTKPNLNDPKYLIYGYISYPQANVFQGVTISNSLKSGDSYNVTAICMNQNGVQSNNSGTNSFIQPDNSGKTVQLSFKFKNSVITMAQRIDIACGVARFFAIPTERVKTEDGFSCSSLKARLLQTSVTNTTNNTNNNTVVPINTYNWFIIKDYFSSFDQSYQIYQTAARDPSFVNNVLRLTTGGINGFPQVDSVSSVTIDAYSTINNANQVPILVDRGSQVWYYSIAKTLSISNIDGYLFAGIGKTPTSTPTILQLRMGLDGNNSALLQKDYRIAINNTNYLLNFTGLNNGTNYTVFFAASNNDPSINALVTTVSSQILYTPIPDTFAINLNLWSFLMLAVMLFIMY